VGDVLAAQANAGELCNARRLWLGGIAFLVPLFSLAGTARHVQMKSTTNAGLRWAEE
jgi:hypothetical protein